VFSAVDRGDAAVALHGGASDGPVHQDPPQRDAPRPARQRPHGEGPGPVRRPTDPKDLFFNASRSEI